MIKKPDHQRNLILIILLLAFLIPIIGIGGYFFQETPISYLFILMLFFWISLCLLIIAYYGIFKKVTFPEKYLPVCFLVFGLVIGGNFLENIVGSTLGAVIGGGVFIGLWEIISNFRSSKHSEEILAQRIGWMSLLLGIFLLILLLLLFIL